MSNYPIPHGWKLVPIEPTERMAQSVYDGTGSLYDFCTVYRAMLDAAPDYVTTEQLNRAFEAAAGKAVK